MDVPERAEVTPEPVSIVRYRKLLGDEADTLTDDEVRDIARHAEAMARVLIALARQGGRIH
jgi:primosomal protein N'